MTSIYGVYHVLISAQDDSFNDLGTFKYPSLRTLYKVCLELLRKRLYPIFLKPWISSQCFVVVASRTWSNWAVMVYPCSGFGWILVGEMKCRMDALLEFFLLVTGYLSRKYLNLSPEHLKPLPCSEKYFGIYRYLPHTSFTYIHQHIIIKRRPNFLNLIIVKLW